jgi:hypothetical protein
MKKIAKKANIMDPTTLGQPSGKRERLVIMVHPTGDQMDVEICLSLQPQNWIKTGKWSQDKYHVTWVAHVFVERCE